MSNVNTRAIEIAKKLLNGATLDYVEKCCEGHTEDTQRYVTFKLLPDRVVNYYTMLSASTQTEHQVILDHSDNIIRFEEGSEKTLDALKGSWVPFPVFYHMFTAAVTVSDSGFGRAFHVDISELIEHKKYVHNTNLFVTSVESVAVDLVKLREILTWEYGINLMRENHKPVTNKIIYRTR